MPLWKTINLSWRHEINKQRERRFGERVDAHDPDAADLQQTGNWGGCVHSDALSRAPQLDLIVGNKPCPGIDQSQRQIRFSGARPTTEKHGVSRDRDRGGMNQQRSRHDSAGSLIQKRAPIVAPAASLRFSAQIMPRCASTICFEIESPSPEWVPNFSPSGRSL
jgi:hypothetical protein